MRIHYYILSAFCAALLAVSCSKQPSGSPDAEGPASSGTPSVAADTVSATETDMAGGASAVSSEDAKTAPDITLNDLDGKSVSLRSLRGKPVVLDFWGSWCVWCVRGFPKMKEYYQKYAGKFEILGIDCNDSDADWREAVKANGLPWLHVYCPEGSPVFDDYDIQGFPTKIVLDAQGKVLKTFLGEDPAFYQYLDELLKIEN